MSSRFPCDPDGSLEREARREERGGPEIRHSEPIARAITKSASQATGMSRDLQIIEAVSKAQGELLGGYARESDAKFKALEEQTTALRIEVAELRGRLEELKSAQPGLKRVA